MKDKLDEKLYAIMKNVKIPQKIDNTIDKSTFKSEKKNKKSIIIKIISIAASIFIVTNMVVVGVNYYYANNNLGCIDEGISTAIGNGYIENVNMKYVKSNGIGVKIDYLLMDDYNLNILFNYEFDRTINERIDEIILEDLLITDENNNIIFCDNPKTYEKFCKKNRIKFNEQRMEGNYNDGGFGKQFIEIENVKVKDLYTLYSTSFPKSKKLYIKFTKLQLISTNFTENEYKEKILLEKKGNWQMNIELPEKFYNRNNTKYILENESENIKLNDATVTNVCMKIVLKSNLNIKKIQVRNEFGEIFKSNMAGENSINEFHNTENQEITISTMLTFSNYKVTDKLELVLELHDGTKVIEKLVKTSNKI